MTRKALITGATDGIGRATAIEMANRGYSIHALGRSEERGRTLIQELEERAPSGDHALYLVDLARSGEVDSFAERYLRDHDRLDVLLLNAGVFPDRGALSADGLELAFAVNYLSRFVLVARLEPLLAAAEAPRVVHLGGSRFVEIPYDRLRAPRYGKMTAIWLASTASALLAEWWSRHTGSSARHTYWMPGIVETGLVTRQGALVRGLSRLMGSISPEEAGVRLADHVDRPLEADLDGRYYKGGRARPWKSRYVEDEERFRRLLEFSREVTGIGTPVTDRPPR